MIQIASLPQAGGRDTHLIMAVVFFSLSAIFKAAEAHLILCCIVDAEMKSYAYHQLWPVDLSTVKEALETLRRTCKLCALCCCCIFSYL